MAVLTLTGLIPDIHKAMTTISRESVGIIPAVSRDSTAEQAALGQQIVSPIVGEMPEADNTPAATSPDTPSQTIDKVNMTISKSKNVAFGITGEEERGLNSAGTLGSINQQRIEQALRKLTNLVESDLYGLNIDASRAYGTAAGLPFNVGDDLTDFAEPMGILDANGVALNDRHMVLGHTSVTRVRGKMATLFQANTANNDQLLRTGSISAQPVVGLDLHQSHAIKKHVAVGTGAGATTDNAGYSEGDVTLTLASAGTGTILAGDIISFAGDAGQYLVKTGNTDVSAGGTVVIAAPGLQQDIAGSATAITVVAATIRNMVFHRSAIQLATRAPALPDGGDSADDSMIVTDPISGLSYQFLVYKQYKQVRYEVGLAWGYKTIMPQNMALLIGA